MRAKTSARGYDSKHQAERARWKAIIDSGRAVFCARCSKPIRPDEPWDLGHDDHDRRLYAGPECRSCNRSAGARRGRRIRRITKLRW